MSTFRSYPERSAQARRRYTIRTSLLRGLIMRVHEGLRSTAGAGLAGFGSRGGHNSYRAGHLDVAPAWRAGQGAEIATVLALPACVLAAVVPLFQARAVQLKRLGGLSPGPAAEVAAYMAPVLARDAHVLGVSPAQHSGAGQMPQLPALTPYLARVHDAKLRETVAETADGGLSALVVLVGDSAIGKTRALYEAAVVAVSHAVGCLQHDLACRPLIVAEQPERASGEPLGIGESVYLAMTASSRAWPISAPPEGGGGDHVEAG